MPDVEIEAPDTGATSRFKLTSIDPKMAMAAGVIALCLGIWVGFKLAGGQVSEPRHLDATPCQECVERAREAEILNADTE